MVVWVGSTKLDVKLPKTSKGTKVTLYYSATLNGIFTPHMIETAQVLIAHDNLDVSRRSIENMFHLAQENTARTVSAIVSEVDAKDNYQVKRSRKNLYSLADMRFAILRTDYLFLYSCILDNRLLEIVRMHEECTSLLMNVLTSAVSEYPVVHLRTPMTNLDTSQHIETMKSRTNWNSCLTKFRNLLDSQSLNFKQSSTSVTFT